MKAPAHVHTAVRLLDRAGVDEGIVGDILEMYEARPSALRLWTQVGAALIARAADGATAKAPRAIQLGLTTVAVALLFAYSFTGAVHVDMASSVRIEQLDGGWVQSRAANGATRLLPTVSFRIRNVSRSPLDSIQVNVLFRRINEKQVWSDVFRRVGPRRSIASGTASDRIVAEAPIGYSGSDAVNRLLNHSRFVDTAVSIYVRHGSEAWTYVGEYPLPRHVVGRESPAGPHIATTSYHTP